MANEKVSTPEPWAQRFWEKVEVRGPDECWPWQAFLNESGYGTFHRPIDRVRRRDGGWTKNAPGAHRVSYELAKGPIPAGQVVRHRCDNPPCVNPAHLFLGTRGENNTERKEKGRNRLDPPRSPWVAARKFKGGSKVQFVPVNERLQDSIVIHPLTSCWVWQRGMFKEGYGQIKVQGRTHHAHRLAWETWVGPIPTGLKILHSCDNPACINVDHLRPGTDADNAADRSARGRGHIGKHHHFAQPGSPRSHGESHAKSKLTDDAVRLIREGMSLEEAARRFGVSRGTVSKARSGFCWKHVEAPPLPRSWGGTKPIINDDDKAEIRRTNMATAVVMRRYGVSRSTALRAKGATY